MERISAKSTLNLNWEKHPDTEKYLKIWYDTAMNSDWRTPTEVKETYANASILKDSRIVFNIKGNSYRLVAKFNYEKQWVFIRFIGSHADYEKIDANKVLKEGLINTKLIKSEAEYMKALKRFEEFFDAPVGIADSDEADILGLLIDEYERKNYAMDAPDPIEAIKIRMEEMQLRQVDLVDNLGGKNRVSEILNRRRKLTVEMIRNLTGRLNLSPRLLIRDYKLAG